MTKKILFSTIVTGILGVILFLLFPKEVEESTRIDITNDPDLHLKDVQIRAFNQSGHLAYELSAAEIEQFTVQHKMLFKHLKILVETENGEQWHMNADLGLIQPDSDNFRQVLEPVELLGSVTVYSGDGNDSEYSFTGTNVIFDPLADTILSNQNVSIKAEGSTYEADSFQFDLTTKHLELRSKPGSQVEIQHDSIEAE